MAQHTYTRAFAATYLTRKQLRRHDVGIVVSCTACSVHSSGGYQMAALGSVLGVTFTPPRVEQHRNSSARAAHDGKHVYIK